MPNAIISTANKLCLVPLLETLEQIGWNLYGTEGTNTSYERATGRRIGSLTDLLIEQGVTSENVDREAVAQQISGLMLVNRCVQLVCVNLREPALRPIRGTSSLHVSLDAGGINMLVTGQESDAIVLTDPSDYAPVGADLKGTGQVSVSYRTSLNATANKHISAHLEAANNLANQLDY